MLYLEIIIVSKLQPHSCPLDP